MSTNMDDSTDPSTGEDYTVSAPGNLNFYTAAQVANAMTGVEVNPRVRFIPDNDPFAKGKVVAINRKHYPSFDSLKESLCKGIGMRVERIMTPHGRTHITNLDQFQANNIYMCTEGRRGRPINVEKGMKPWHGGKLNSGKHRVFLGPSGNNAHHRVGRVGSDPGYHEKRLPPKKITFIRNGDADFRRTFLVNRRTPQTYEEFIADVSSSFGFQVHKIFTEQGKVATWDEILKGPDCYIVAGPEPFRKLEHPINADRGPKPLAAWGEPKRSRPQPTIAEKLKDSRDKQMRTRGKWLVGVTTNESPEAATTANVMLQVYGNKGQSPVIPLAVSEGEVFQSGNCDEFETSVGNIGKIYKIRLSHDNTGDDPSWLCDEVKMRDIHTGEELYFECRRWIAEDKDDNEVCRELPAIRANEATLPVLGYEVTTVTGDLWNASTDANVYMTIYGENGDTGVRRLARERREDKFRKGQTDVFDIEAVHLGNVKRVIIGHDGNGAGQGWFLERILVAETGGRTHGRWEFYCNRWLDDGEEDGKIVRELKPVDQYLGDYIDKQLFEYEKWKFETGNQVRLYSVSSHRPMRVKPDATVDADGDYDDPTARPVLMKQSIFKPIARRANIRVFQSFNHERFHLAIDNAKILGQGRGGAYSELRVRVQPDRSILFESVKYPTQHLAIKPNGKPEDPRMGQRVDDIKRFYVYCKGIMRDRGIVMMCTSLTQTLAMDEDNVLIATGKRNRIAHFRVHKVAEDGVRMFESVVYPGHFLRMKEGRCDANGDGDVYSQFRIIRIREEACVLMESMANKGIYLGMTPDGAVKPTVDTGDMNTRFYPEVIEFGDKKGEARKEQQPVSPENNKLRRKRRQPHVLPVPINSDRSPRDTDVSPRTDEPPLKQEREASAASVFEDGDWKVWINTFETAEHADIVLVVYGDAGCSGPIILGTAGQHDMFTSRNQDQFKVNLGSVGNIYKIRLELLPNHKRRQPSWKVKDVRCKDMTSKETFKFKFNRWLSRQKEDGDLMRELPAIRPKQPVIPVVTYHIFVYTASQPGADTDANVYLRAYGERGDWGRRHLMRSNHENMFEEGQCDEFELEAVSLGDLHRCVLAHDGRDPGEGWFCDKVIIREGEQPTHEWVFTCNRWLDTGLEDKAIETVLDLEEWVGWRKFVERLQDIIAIGPERGPLSEENVNHKLEDRDDLVSTKENRGWKIVKAGVAVKMRLKPRKAKISDWKRVSDHLVKITNLGWLKVDERLPSIVNLGWIKVAKSLPVMKDLGWLKMNAKVPSMVNLGWKKLSERIPDIVTHGWRKVSQNLPVVKNLGWQRVNQNLPLIANLGWMKVDKCLLDIGKHGFIRSETMVLQKPTLIPTELEAPSRIGVKYLGSEAGDLSDVEVEEEEDTLNLSVPSWTPRQVCRTLKSPDGSERRVQCIHCSARFTPDIGKGGMYSKWALNKSRPTSIEHGNEMRKSPILLPPVTPSSMKESMSRSGSPSLNKRLSPLGYSANQDLPPNDNDRGNDAVHNDETHVRPVIMTPSKRLKRQNSKPSEVREDESELAVDAKTNDDLTSDHKVDDLEKHNESEIDSALTCPDDDAKAYQSPPFPQGISENINALYADSLDNPAETERPKEELYRADSLENLQHVSKGNSSSQSNSLDITNAEEKYENFEKGTKGDEKEDSTLTPGVELTPEILAINTALDQSSVVGSTENDTHSDESREQVGDAPEVLRDSLESECPRPESSNLLEDGTANNDGALLLETQKAVDERIESVEEEKPNDRDGRTVQNLNKELVEDRETGGNERIISPAQEVVEKREEICRSVKGENEESRVHSPMSFEDTDDLPNISKDSIEKTDSGTPDENLKGDVIETAGVAEDKIEGHAQLETDSTGNEQFNAPADEGSTSDGGQNDKNMADSTIESSVDGGNIEAKEKEKSAILDETDSATLSEDRLIENDLQLEQDGKVEEKKQMEPISQVQEEEEEEEEGIAKSDSHEVQTNDRPPEGSEVSLTKNGSVQSNVAKSDESMPNDPEGGNTENTLDFHKVSLPDGSENSSEEIISGEILKGQLKDKSEEKILNESQEDNGEVISDVQACPNAEGADIRSEESGSDEKMLKEHNNKADEILTSTNKKDLGDVKPDLHKNSPVVEMGENREEAVAEDKMSQEYSDSALESKKISKEEENENLKSDVHTVHPSEGREEESAKEEKILGEPGDISNDSIPKVRQEGNREVLEVPLAGDSAESSEESVGEEKPMQLLAERSEDSSQNPPQEEKDEVKPTEHKDPVHEGADANSTENVPGKKMFERPMAEESTSSTHEDDRESNEESVKEGKMLGEPEDITDDNMQNGPLEENREMKSDVQKGAVVEVADETSEVPDENSLKTHIDKVHEGSSNTLEEHDLDTKPELHEVSPTEGLADRISEEENNDLKSNMQEVPPAEGLGENSEETISKQKMVQDAEDKSKERIPDVTQEEKGDIKPDEHDTPTPEGAEDNSPESVSDEVMLKNLIDESDEGPTSTLEKDLRDTKPELHEAPPTEQLAESGKESIRDNACESNNKVSDEQNGDLKSNMQEVPPAEGLGVSSEQTISEQKMVQDAEDKSKERIPDVPQEEKGDIKPDEHDTPTPEGAEDNSQESVSDEVMLKNPIDESDEGPTSTLEKDLRDTKPELHDAPPTEQLAESGKESIRDNAGESNNKVSDEENGDLKSNVQEAPPAEGLGVSSEQTVSEEKMVQETEDNSEDSIPNVPQEEKGEIKPDVHDTPTPEGAGENSQESVSDEVMLKNPIDESSEGTTSTLEKDLRDTKPELHEAPPTEQLAESGKESIRDNAGESNNKVSDEENGDLKSNTQEVPPAEGLGVSSEQTISEEKMVQETEDKSEDSIPNVPQEEKGEIKPDVHDTPTPEGAEDNSQESVSDAVMLKNPIDESDEGPTSTIDRLADKISDEENNDLTSNMQEVPPAARLGENNEETISEQKMVQEAEDKSKERIPDVTQEEKGDIKPDEHDTPTPEGAEDNSPESVSDEVMLKNPIDKSDEGSTGTFEKDLGNTISSLHEFPPSEGAGESSKESIPEDEGLVKEGMKSDTKEDQIAERPIGSSEEPVSDENMLKEADEGRQSTSEDDLVDSRADLHEADLGDSKTVLHKATPTQVAGDKCEELVTEGQVSQEYVDDTITKASESEKDDDLNSDVLKVPPTEGFSEGNEKSGVEEKTLQKNDSEDGVPNVPTEDEGKVKSEVHEGQIADGANKSSEEFVSNEAMTKEASSKIDESSPNINEESLGDTKPDLPETPSTEGTSESIEKSISEDENLQKSMDQTDETVTMSMDEEIEGSKSNGQKVPTAEESGLSSKEPISEVMMSQKAEYKSEDDMPKFPQEAKEEVESHEHKDPTAEERVERSNVSESEAKALENTSNQAKEGLSNTLEEENIGNRKQDLHEDTERAGKDSKFVLEDKDLQNPIGKPDESMTVPWEEGNEELKSNVNEVPLVEASTEISEESGEEKKILQDPEDKPENSSPKVPSEGKGEEETYPINDGTEENSKDSLTDENALTKPSNKDDDSLPSTSQEDLKDINPGLPEAPPTGKTGEDNAESSADPNSNAHEIPIAEVSSQSNEQSLLDEKITDSADDSMKKLDETDLKADSLASERDEQMKEHVPTEDPLDMPALAKDSNSENILTEKDDRNDDKLPATENEEKADMNVPNSAGHSDENDKETLDSHHEGVPEGQLVDEHKEKDKDGADNKGGETVEDKKKGRDELLKPEKPEGPSPLKEQSDNAEAEDQKAVKSDSETPDSKIISQNDGAMDLPIEKDLKENTEVTIGDGTKTSKSDGNSQIEGVDNNIKKSEDQQNTEDANPKQTQEDVPSVNHAEDQGEFDSSKNHLDSNDMVASDSHNEVEPIPVKGELLAQKPIQEEQLQDTPNASESHKSNTNDEKVDDTEDSSQQEGNIAPENRNGEVAGEPAGKVIDDKEKADDTFDTKAEIPNKEKLETAVDENENGAGDDMNAGSDTSTSESKVGNTGESKPESLIPKVNVSEVDATRNTNGEDSILSGKTGKDSEDATPNDLITKESVALDREQKLENKKTEVDELEGSPAVKDSTKESQDLLDVEKTMKQEEANAALTAGPTSTKTNAETSPADERRPKFTHLQHYQQTLQFLQYCPKVYRPIGQPQQPEPVVEEEEKPDAFDWKAWIKTGDAKNMGTKADVVLIAYGDRGHTEPIPLEVPVSEKVPFRPAQKDEFKINFGKDIGKMYKIRIGHDSPDVKQGWFLEEVKLRDLNAKETFNFKFNRWLSRGEEDLDTWREMPVTRPGITPYPVVTYVVEVFTGTLPGADTDAEAYIHLFGTRGDAGQRALIKSNKKRKFQSGQTDIFQLQAVSLDDVNKVVLGHGDTDKGAGWFVEKVVIREKGEEETFNFPCSRWFDTGQDDRKIERVLAKKDIQQEVETCDMVVTVTTGPDAGMGTQAPISIIAYGDKDHTDLIPLVPKDKKTKVFKHGNTDEFKIDLLKDIGRLYKIRIGHESLDPKHGWFLEKVKIKDTKLDEVYTFEFDRWLAVGKDDSDTWRELPVIYPGEKTLPVLTYKVEVYTGNVGGADTDANCFIHMFGTRGDAGKRALVKSNKRRKFRKGQVDTFDLDAVSLNEVDKVVLGHDGKEKGAGWFVSRVIIKETEEADAEEPRTFHFPCERWFDSGQDDKKIIRVLREEKPKPKEEKLTDWTLWVTTGPDMKMGTQAPVTITAYGDKGQTEPIPLTPKDKKTKTFKPGNTDEFKVDLNKEIGKLYKIRIGHDSLDSEHAWFLEKVKVKDNRTNELFNFEADSWLSPVDDGCDTWRELPAVYPGKQPVPEITYIVEVYTGTEAGAETEANCYIHMFGTRGDSGRRPLIKSNKRKKFKKGQTDVFGVDAVSLNEITKVMLGHDGSERGAGWYVSKVIIRESEPTDEEKTRTFHFGCDRWFETSMDDGRIERFLIAGLPLPIQNDEEEEEVEEEPEEEEEQPPKEGVHILVKTGPDSIAPKAHSVILTVYGANDKTDDIVLDANNNEPLPYTPRTTTEKGGQRFNEKGERRLFMAGNVDEFDIEWGELGELYKVRVGRQEDLDDWEGWHLLEVVLVEKSTAREHIFHFDRWMARDKEDCDIFREAASPSAGLSLIPYRISVYTGDHWAADTDANVYLHMFGSRGDAGKRRLFKSDNQFKFQKNQVDTFIMEAVDLENIERVVVSHDGVGHGAGWFLDKVIISKEDDKEEGQQSSDNASQNQRDKTEAQKELDEIERDKKELASEGEKGLVFYCGRWLDTEEGDGKTERELHLMEELTGKEIKIKATQDEPRPRTPADRADSKTPNQSCLGSLFSRFGRKNKRKTPKKPPKNEYQKQNLIKKTARSFNVKIKTSDIEDAGTHAHVYLIICGNDGISDRIVMGKGGSKSKDFDRGAEYEQKVDIEDIGEIYKVQVTHDNTDSSPSWHLQMITLTEESTGEVIKFYCDRWLSEEYDADMDGIIYRELPAIYPGKSVSPVIQYNIKVTTGSERGAQTDADVFISLEGTCGNVVHWPLTSTERLWQTGQTDEFMVEMIYLGDITEVILEHNGRDEGSRWYVEKVSVKERVHALLEWVFPCNDWLTPETEGFSQKVLQTTGPELIPNATTKNDKTESKTVKRSSDKSDKGGKGERSVEKDEGNSNDSDWTVTIKAKDPPEGANLRMIAYGVNGESKKLQLIGEKDEEEGEGVHSHKNAKDGKDKNKDSQGKKKEKGKQEDRSSPKNEKSKGKNKDKGKNDQLNRDEDKDEDEKENARKELEEIDEFKLDIGDVGPLIRIRLFYTGEEEWFIYRIKMKNDKTKQEFHYIHDSWVAAAASENETTKDLAAIMPDITPLQEVEYEISVKTGEQPRADTEADVYCILVGSMGDTGRCILDSPINNETKFRKGQNDTFKVTALEVGTITKVIIGHDSMGRGLGWYCNHVAISSDNSPTQMVFPCNRWLDTGCDDRAIERELLSSSVLNIPEGIDEQEKQKTSGLWKCTINIDQSAVPKSSDKSRRSSESNKLFIYGKDYKEDEIIITVYGESGASKPLTLGRPGSSKTEMQKEVAVGDIGRVEKVRLTDGRIGQDGIETWSISSLKMTDSDTEEELVFNFQDVVGQTSYNARYELPAVRPGEIIQPLLTYKVNVRSFDAGNLENVSSRSSSKERDQTNSKSKGKPENKNNKNKTNKDNKDSDKSKDEKTEEQEDKYVWIRLHGVNGDSGWNMVPVNKDITTKDKGPNGKKPQLKRKGTYGENDGLGKDSNQYINEDYDDEHVKAVTKIQAGYRGHKAREDVKEIKKNIERNKDYNEDHKKAATMIQAGFRGYKARENVNEIRKKNKMNENYSGEHAEAATKIQAGFRGYQGRKAAKHMKQERDLAKYGEEHERAAITIQAGFRGFEARKRVKAMMENPEEEELHNIFAVDLGPITKVTLVNISGGTLAIKDVQIIPGEFSGRLQIFNCYSVVPDAVTDPRGVDLDHIDDDDLDTSDRAQEDAGLSLTQYHYGDLSPAAVPLDQTPDLPKSSGTWTVKTWTGKDSDSKPNQDVCLVVCGRLKESEPIPLKGQNKKTNFKPGQEDEFKVKIPDDIGDIFKLRIGFHPMPRKAEWFLEKIHFEDDTTHDDFTCEVRSSLKVDNNSDAWLEAPVVWPSVPLSEARLYDVSVYTGDTANASTDANVYMIVRGINGESGKRELKNSNGNKKKFQKSQVDEFTIEAVDLHDLQVVTIGHDKNKKGKGWFLEKVVIKEGDFVNNGDGEKGKEDQNRESRKDKEDKNSQKNENKTKGDGEQTDKLKKYERPNQPHRTFVFPCSRWLDEGEDDGKIERDLEVLPLEEPKKEYTWRMAVKTAELAQGVKVPPPSKAQRVVVIYGDKDKSEVIPLSSSEENLYVPGYTNEFEFKTLGELGSLYKIRFGFSEETNDEHIWAMELVRLTCNETGQLYVFEAGSDATLTLDDKNDGWKELRLQKLKAKLPIHRYHVETHTGINPGSGTDANVYIEIYGEQGDTGRRKLLKSSKPNKMFENGKVDCFVVEAVDLKELTKVVIGHDGTGLDSGWFLDKVIIKESEEAPKSYHFKCERWFDEGEDDGALERTLELEKVDGGEAKDGDYMVLVATGNKNNSGTDAKAFITVFGEKGQTDPLPLEKDGKKEGIDIFADGNTDEFKIYIDPDNVGKCKKIRLEHDNSGAASGWYVKTVLLVDMYNEGNPELEFPVNRWLCDDEDDGDIVREIPAKHPGVDALPVTKYEVKVVTGSDFGAGTDATVRITLHGKKGDSGKRLLKKNKEDRNKFESGNIDTFSIEAVDLGSIEKVTIGHDGTGAGSGWFLEKVIVEDTLTGEEGAFPLSDWLDADKPKGAEREIKLADSKQNKKK